MILDRPVGSDTMFEIINGQILSLRLFTFPVKLIKYHNLILITILAFLPVKLVSLVSRPDPNYNTLIPPGKTC